MRNLLLVLAALISAAAETHTLEPRTHSNVFSAYKTPIEEADYGDVLEIHLQVRLNPTWGYTRYPLIPAFLDPHTVENLYKNSFKKGAVRADNLVNWELDLHRGTAKAD